jgi:hypothetical protein
LGQAQFMAEIATLDSDDRLRRWAGFASRDLSRTIALNRIDACGIDLSIDRSPFQLLIPANLASSRESSD